MAFKLTLLGTGDSAQTPVFGCECLVCEAAREDSALIRKPCSALLEFDQTTLLIDSGLMDLTQRFKPNQLNAILQTHYHADHVQGLLHFRWGVGAKVPVYGPIDENGFADLYKHPGMLVFKPGWQHGDVCFFNELKVTALALNHSKPTVGYLFSQGGKHVAYLTDTKGLPPETLEYLKTLHLQCVVIDCSFPPSNHRFSDKPKSHNDVNDVIHLSQQLSCDEWILSHINHTTARWLQTNGSSLPNHFTLSHDGLVRLFT